MTSLWLNRLRDLSLRKTRGGSEFFIVEFVIEERIAVLNLGVGAEAAFNLGQRVKRVVPALTISLREALKLLIDAIFDPEQHVPPPQLQS